MKQYMLSVHHVDGEPMPDEDTIQQMFKDVDAFNLEVQDAGVLVFAGGLEGRDAATVVRDQGGQILKTDGPFAEAKEFLGGFWVLKAEDLNAVLTWAEKATRACRGPVEVRPFQDEAKE